MTTNTHFFAYGIAEGRNLMILGEVAQAPSKYDEFKSGNVFVFEHFPDVYASGDSIVQKGYMVGHQFPEGLDFNAGYGTIKVTDVYHPLSSGLEMMRVASEYRSACLNVENARNALKKTRDMKFTFGMRRPEVEDWLTEAEEKERVAFDKFYAVVILNLGNEVE